MKPKTNIIICMGSSCFSRGNQISLDLIKTYLKKNNLEGNISFSGQLCSEHCSKGPIVTINQKIYEDVHPDNVIDILQKALNIPELS